MAAPAKPAAAPTAAPSTMVWVEVSACWRSLAWAGVWLADEASAVPASFDGS